MRDLDPTVTNSQRHQAYVEANSGALLQNDLELLRVRSNKHEILVTTSASATHVLELWMYSVSIGAY